MSIILLDSTHDHNIDFYLIYVNLDLFDSDLAL